MLEEAFSLEVFDETDVEDIMEKCPIRFFNNIIGGKWKILVLWELRENNVLRFNELRRLVTGITNTMLTKSLIELEKSNLIIRTQYNEMPLRVEYRLSNKGNSLVPILKELSEWSTNELSLKDDQ